MKHVIHTIGHSTHPLSDFLHLLQTHDIHHVKVTYAEEGGQLRLLRPPGLP